MADTGKLAIEGYSAGAIKYMVLDGLVPSTSGPLSACLASEGYGQSAMTRGRVLLDGFVTNPSSGSGAYYIFGDAVVR